MNFGACAPGRRLLSENCGYRFFLAIPHELDADFLAGSLEADRISEFPAVVDSLFIDPDDDVVDSKTGQLCRRAGFYVRYKRATVDFRAEGFCAFLIDRRNGYAQKTASYFTEIQDLAHDRARNF